MCIFIHFQIFLGASGLGFSTRCVVPVLHLGTLALLDLCWKRMRVALQETLWMIVARRLVLLLIAPQVTSWKISAKARSQLVAAKIDAVTLPAASSNALPTFTWLQRHQKLAETLRVFAAPRHAATTHAPSHCYWKWMLLALLGRQMKCAAMDSSSAPPTPTGVAISSARWAAIESWKNFKNGFVWRLENRR